MTFAIATALAAAPVTLTTSFSLDDATAMAKSDKGKSDKGKSKKSKSDKGKSNKGKSDKGKSAEANRGGGGNGGRGASQNARPRGGAGGSWFASASEGGDEGTQTGKPRRNDWSKEGAGEYKAALAAWKAGKKRGQSLDARMGALHAANASPNAMANAAPNSRVGRIAAYAAAYEDAQALAGDYEAAEMKRAELEAAYNEAVAGLEGLTPPDEGAIKEAEEKVEALSTQWTEALSAEEGAEAGDPDAIKALLDEADKELQQLMDEKEAYETAIAEADGLKSDLENAEGEVERLAGEVEDAEDGAMQSLADASNKPVDEEIQDAVNALLGL